MLEGNLKLLVNRRPYGDLFVEGIYSFDAMLESIIGQRAMDINAKHADGLYPGNSVGLVLLDPTAPPSISSENAVMAYFVVGEEGERFLPNALAKACEHRDHQASAGSVLYSQPHRLADGDFRWGHSAEVEGTIVGVSGLSEIQDRYQGQLFAAEFNYEIARFRLEWAKAHPGGDWFNDQDKPGKRYAGTLDQVRLVPWSTATT